MLGHGRSCISLRKKSGWAAETGKQFPVAGQLPQYSVRLFVILPEKLHEYPQQDVIDGSAADSASILEDCLNQNDGVLQLLHRYAGRTFCTPGKRLRLDEGSYYPDYMGGTGLDEVWMCCTVPIVTGVIDTRTNKAPFREGEAHVLTPGGQVISLQDLILANPEAVMGVKITALSTAMYGKPT